MMTIMEPPIMLHEQCETQEENTEATIHLPSAKFDIVVNRIGSVGTDEDHEIAFSFNGSSCISEMVVSNKTDTTITKSNPSM